MTRRRVLVLVALLVVVGVGMAWWQLAGGDDAPPPLSVSDLPAATPGAGSAAAATLDGSWTVRAGGASQAGMRIVEHRLGGLEDNTAVGRTADVTGTLAVARGRVRAARFRVDLSTLEFTDDPGLPVANRSDYLKVRAIETDRYPTAGFSLAAPIDVTALTRSRGASADETFVRRVRGRLALHGVTRPIAFDVAVRRTGDGFALATRTPVPVELADFAITPPVLAGISEVSSTGQFEFLVVVDRRTGS